ncbi:hypothetical protein [uncultured Arcticibacterium sp.]|uniref:GH39 family glycosyl hydrolase n=1 Tax=uncultured Arcticibacterium sp. TaxID=2173042 RepID=UPI0030F6A8DF
MNILKYLSITSLMVGAFSCDSSSNNGEWKSLGQLETRDAKEIESSTWSIGGETMDRDYTDYQSYKEYLGPLGAKRIRLQGGWARTEKVKGEYDFEWLDKVIPDAAERGVSPWVELSYGNPIYEGGGEAKLAGLIPMGEEALTAWDNWTRAMVNRYKSHVPEWEIWNEPDINKTHTGRQLGEFYLRTAKIVKEEQPEARLIALGMASVTKLDFVRDFMDYLKENDGLQFIDVFSYHGYTPNPSTSYPKIEILRELVWSYNSDIEFMQGENGAPSTPKEVTIGALRQYDWTELSQAKWNLRRMMGDHGRGIATNLFTISDMHYAAGDHMVGVNTKGILKTNPDKTIERPKMSYKAAQHAFSLFDSQIELLKNEKPITDQDSVSIFQYRHKKNGGTITSLWSNEGRPAEEYQSKVATVTLENASFEKPVLVELISGNVLEIPEANWKKDGMQYVFSGIPIPDYPVLIAEKATLLLK